MNEVPSASASVAKLINTIHGIASSKQNSPVLVGLVIAPLPDIKIATSDIVLDKNDLYINAFLLKNYSRSSRGKLKQTNERGNVEIPSGKGNIKTASAAKRGGVGKPSFVLRLVITTK